MSTTANSKLLLVEGKTGEGNATLLCSRGGAVSC